MRLPKKPSDARKEVKRKARNWLDKQRPDRGVAKKRYHDLEEGVIFVFSKTTKVASLDMHTATIIVKKLLDKIVALVPDYRELCGMKNPVPHRHWIRDCLIEAKRRQLREYGERSSVIDEKAVEKLGYIWLAIEGYAASQILNAGQTCMYLGFDGQERKVWTSQPFVGVKCKKGQLTYTFMFCLSADGSFLFTPHVYGKQYWPMWCSKAQDLHNPARAVVPVSVTEECTAEATLLLHAEADAVRILESEVERATSERREAHAVWLSSPKQTQTRIDNRATWKSLVAEETRAMAAHDAAQRQYSATHTAKVKELVLERWTPPDTSADEGFYAHDDFEARSGRELQLPVVFERSQDVKKLEKRLAASESAHKSLQTKEYAARRALKTSEKLFEKHEKKEAELRRQMDEQDKVITLLNEDLDKTATHGQDTKPIEKAIELADSRRRKLASMRSIARQRAGKAWEKISDNEERLEVIATEKEAAWEEMVRVMHSYALSDDDAVMKTGPLNLMDCRYQQQSKGWMDTPTMVKWFVALARAVKAKEKPVILILDNVAFHHRAWNIAKGWEELEGVTVVFLPSEATSYTQPLDLGIFAFTQMTAKKLLSQFYMATQIVWGDSSKVSALHKINYMVQAWEKLKLKPDTVAGCFGSSPVFADHEHVLPSKTVQKRVDERLAKEAAARALRQAQQPQEHVRGGRNDGTAPPVATIQSPPAPDGSTTSGSSSSSGGSNMMRSSSDQSDTLEDSLMDSPMGSREESLGDTLEFPVHYEDGADDEADDAAEVEDGDEVEPVAPEEEIGINDAEFGEVSKENMLDLISRLDLNHILPHGTQRLIRNTNARRAHLADKEKARKREANRLRRRAAHLKRYGFLINMGRALPQDAPDGFPRADIPRARNLVEPAPASFQSPHDHVEPAVVAMEVNEDSMDIDTADHWDQQDVEAAASPMVHSETPTRLPPGDAQEDTPYNPYPPGHPLEHIYGTPSPQPSHGYTALRPLDTPSSSAFHTQTDTQANTQANTQADTPSLTQSSFNQLQWATCLTAWAARLVVPALALLATGALAPLS